MDETSLLNILPNMEATVVIDILDVKTASVAGLHWQVAQATSLTNCRVFASTAADTTAMGMFTENGSSGFMGDCFFSGGAYGICKCIPKACLDLSNN